MGEGAGEFSHVVSFIWGEVFGVLYLGCFFMGGFAAFL